MLDLLVMFGAGSRPVTLRAMSTDGRDLVAVK